MVRYSSSNHRRLVDVSQLDRPVFLHDLFVGTFAQLSASPFLHGHVYSITYSFVNAAVSRHWWHSIVHRIGLGRLPAGIDIRPYDLSSPKVPNSTRSGRFESSSVRGIDAKAEEGSEQDYRVGSSIRQLFEEPNANVSTIWGCFDWVGAAMWFLLTVTVASPLLSFQGRLCGRIGQL